MRWRSIILELSNFCCTFHFGTQLPREANDQCTFDRRHIWIDLLSVTDDMF